jgi:hypothetical protein
MSEWRVPLPYRLSRMGADRPPYRSYRSYKSYPMPAASVLFRLGARNLLAAYFFLNGPCTSRRSNSQRTTPTMA